MNQSCQTKLLSSVYITFTYICCCQNCCLHKRKSLGSNTDVVFDAAVRLIHVEIIAHIICNQPRDWH